MTLGHRLAVAYAIMATSLLRASSHANSHLRALDERRPDLNLKQTHRNHLSMAFTIRYSAGGVLTAIVFLAATRRKRNRTEGPNQASEPIAGKPGSG